MSISTQTQAVVTKFIAIDNIYIYQKHDVLKYFVIPQVLVRDSNPYANCKELDILSTCVVELSVGPVLISSANLRQRWRWDLVINHLPF